MADFFLTRMGAMFFESTMPELVRQLRLLNTNLEKLIEKNKEPDVSIWNRDDIQFPRLLAEIRASGLTSEQYADLTKSMDLHPDMIDDLLERAENAWNRVKADTKSSS